MSIFIGCFILILVVTTFILHGKVLCMNQGRSVPWFWPLMGLVVFVLGGLAGFCFALGTPLATGFIAVLLAFIIFLIIFILAA